MYPVYINSLNEGHHFEDVCERLIEICNEHIKNDRAFCFCLFLYDETNAAIIKILHDAEYWNALHHTSGDLLTIFSIIKKSKGSMRARSVPYQTMRLQLNAHKAYTKNELPVENNKLREKYFKDISEINYPSLLFFQIDNEKILDTMIVELREKKIEETYLEIKEIIDAAVTGLKRFDRTNKENRVRSFEQIVGELTKLQNKYNLIKIAKAIPVVKDFIEEFKK